MTGAVMRLRDGVDTIMSAGIDAREASRDEWQSCVDTGVDSIISLVREAMLSDAAVDEAARIDHDRMGGYIDFHGGTVPWDELDRRTQDVFRRKATNYIADALDAAFGPASDQHGEGTA